MSNKSISMTSKTLSKITIFSIALSGLLAIPAHAKTYDFSNLGPCFQDDNEEVVAVNQKDQTCIYKGEVVAYRKDDCIEKKATSKGILHTGISVGRSCFFSVQKEYAKWQVAQVAGSGGNRGSSGHGSGCNGCSVGEGGSDSISSRGAGSGHASRGTGRSRDAGSDALDEAHKFHEICDSDGSLTKALADSSTRIKEAKARLAKHPEEGCRGDDCLPKISELKADMERALNSAVCHSSCVTLALSDTGACNWQNLKRKARFEDAADFCSTLMASDREGKAYTKWYNAGGLEAGQDPNCAPAMDKNQDKAALCTKMELDPACAQVMAQDDFKCPAYVDASDEYRKAKSDYDQDKALVLMLGADSDTTACKVDSLAQAVDADKNRKSASLACLTDEIASCSRDDGDLGKGPMAKSEERYESINTALRANCPTCSINSGGGSGGGGGGGGGGCNGRCGTVSTAAQIIGAIAPIGVAGLGVLGNVLNNNACTSIANRQLTIQQNIGILGPVNQCGIGSFGAGGFASGGFGNSQFGFGNTLGFGQTGFGYPSPGFSGGFNGGFNTGFNNGFGNYGYQTPGFSNGINTGLGINGSNGFALGGAQYGLSNQFGNNGFGNNGFGNNGFGNNGFGNNGYALGLLNQSNAYQNLANTSQYGQLLQSGSYLQQGLYNSGYTGYNGYQGYSGYPSYTGYPSSGLSINAGFNMNAGTGYQQQVPYYNAQQSTCGVSVPCGYYGY